MVWTLHSDLENTLLLKAGWGNIFDTFGPLVKSILCHIFQQVLRSNPTLSSTSIWFFLYIQITNILYQRPIRFECLPLLWISVVENIWALGEEIIRTWWSNIWKYLENIWKNIWALGEEIIRTWWDNSSTKGTFEIFQDMCLLSQPQEQKIMQYVLYLANLS